MESIESLLAKLNLVCEKGSSSERLTISKELDVEITKYMKSFLASRKQLVQDKRTCD